MQQLAAGFRLVSGRSTSAGSVSCLPINGNNDAYPQPHEQWDGEERERATSFYSRPGPRTPAAAPGALIPGRMPARIGSGPASVPSSSSRVGAGRSARVSGELLYEGAEQSCAMGSF
jgi:hypothetical protein